MGVRLDIIKAMLRITGEFAKDSDILDHPDVITANAVLDDHRREVLQKGYWFNEKTMNYNPDVNGYIYVPDNVMTLDATDVTRNVSIRGGKLYDNDNETFKFTQPVEVDVIIDLPEDDIPPVAVSVIKYRSVLDYGAMQEITGTPIDTTINNLQVAENTLNTEVFRRSDTSFSNNKVNQRMQLFRNQYSTRRKGGYVGGYSRVQKP